MQVRSNLENLELAQRFPVAFGVGCAIGVTIPVITLGAKVAAQNVHWAFWLVAVMGGVVSLMSLYSFGVGAFGADGYGKRKALAFCGLIEFSWLCLPYHVPPSAKPLYGMLVETELQWFFLAVSFLGFALAVLVNGVEIAATMAHGWEVSMAQREKERQAAEREKNPEQGQVEADAARWRAVQDMLRSLHETRQRPRLKVVGGRYVLTDSLAVAGELELFNGMMPESAGNGAAKEAT